MINNYYFYLFFFYICLSFQGLCARQANAVFQTLTQEFDREGCVLSKKIFFYKVAFIIFLFKELEGSVSQFGKVSACKIYPGTIDSTGFVRLLFAISSTMYSLRNYLQFIYLLYKLLLLCQFWIVDKNSGNIFFINKTESNCFLFYPKFVYHVFIGIITRALGEYKWLQLCSSAHTAWGK